MTAHPSLTYKDTEDTEDTEFSGETRTTTEDTEEGEVTEGGGGLRRGCLARWLTFAVGMKRRPGNTARPPRGGCGV